MPSRSRTVMLTLLLAATACGHATGDRLAQQGSPTPSVQAVNAAPSAPSCAGVLRGIGRMSAEGEMNHWMAEVRLTNTGRMPCAVAPRVTATLVGSSGHAVARSDRPGWYSWPTVNQVVALGPGRSLWLELSDTASDPTTGVTYTLSSSVEVTLLMGQPGATRVTLRVPMGPDAQVSATLRRDPRLL